MGSSAQTRGPPSSVACLKQWPEVDSYRKTGASMSDTSIDISPASTYFELRKFPDLDVVSNYLVTCSGSLVHLVVQSLLELL